MNTKSIENYELEKKTIIIFFQKTTIMDNKVKTNLIDTIYSNFKGAENPDELMNFLLIDCIENAIGYWCDDYGDYVADEVWDAVKRGETLVYGSYSDDEYGRLTLKSISKALNTLKKDTPEVYDDIVNENWDAEDCDCFFQTAIFGEMIFG